MEFPLAFVYRKINELEIRLMIMAIPSRRNHFFCALTSAAGFPPEDIHSNSISLSSVVTM